MVSTKASDKNYRQQSLGFHSEPNTQDPEELPYRSILGLALCLHQQVIVLFEATSQLAITQTKQPMAQRS